MYNLPAYVPAIFLTTFFVTVLFFYLAAKYAVPVLAILLFWAGFQAVLGVNFFYTETSSLPPRILLMALPPFILIAVLFATAKGRRFIDGLDIKFLTLLHIIRVPVELVLFWLFLGKLAPQLMTFEGRNFDIIAGVTAPFVYYFGFVKKVLHKKILIAWNFICLALLINIVVNAALSAPSVLQQFAFKQPNIAILYFPFNLLPSVIVPLVLFAHLAAIRQLQKTSFR
jgi:hypothetical protein